MRTHANHQFKSGSKFAQIQAAQHPAWSQPALLLTTIAMVLAMVGLSSCAGYTSAAKTGTGSPLSGILSASATTLGFGDVAVANTSTQTLTVTNTGTAPVTIAQASISGAAFTVVGGMPSGTIAVGQSINAQVQFAPTAAGATSGTITIVSDATDSPLDISLTGTGAQAGLSVSPATWNFSNTAVGQTTSENVRLTNTGTSSVVINLATVSGNAFGMSGLSLPKTLSAGQSMTFSAQFAPTAAGAAQGSISFTDNAPNSPQTLTLTGTGVATSATLGASPASVSFGNVSVGSNGQQTVTLTNSGNASATISAIAATGTGFSVTGLAAPITLAANQTATFTAQFAPTTTGSASGSITISSSANNATLSIPLSGSGTQANLVANPANVSFSNVIVGANGTSSVTLTNSGSASVSVSQANVSGAGFSISGLATPTTLAAGQTTAFTAKFAPTSAGSASGSISIVNSSPASPLVINLTGAGVASQARITLSPASISFGSEAVGSTTSQTVSVSNPGNAALTITQLAVSGPGYSINGPSMPMTITPGSSSSFGVTFAPTSPGSAIGTISITSNASGSPATIAISGNGTQGQLTANPSTIAFGSVGISNSGSQTVTLTNSGSASITISQASASGTGFSIAGLATPLTLGVGQSTNFTVEFTPTTAGSATGTISIVSNAPNSPTTIVLSGTGAQGQLGASPSAVTFGSVPTGNTGTQTVTLTNSGVASLTISQAAASGAEFSISGLTTPLTLAAGKSTSFAAQFAPTAGGSVTGTISITSNSPNSPTTISMTGTGAQAQLAASPTSLALGSVAVGASASQTVTLTNSGTASLTVSQATASGAGFSIGGIATPLTINAGQIATFTAQFAPTTTGNATGSISIVSNAPNSPLAIALTGTGTQPQIAATPSSAAFGNVSTGTNNSQTITLSNSGSASLTISSVSVTGTGFNISGISAPLTILAGKNATFNAIFAPTTAGAVSGSISLVSNAPSSPLAISLSGTGIAATKVLSLSTSSLSFGNVNDGSSNSLSVALTNNGNANVAISNVGVTGAGFSTSGVTVGEMLTPNQSATLTVQFAPTTAGAVTGSVSISSDATNSPSTISTSGTGVSTTPHTVALGWTASTGTDITGYNVYRGTTSNGPYSTKLNTSLVGSVQFTDSNVTSGLTYYYVVTAVDSNNVESTFSNQATAVIP
jgi:hypothetical protein